MSFLLLTWFVSGHTGRCVGLNIRGEWRQGSHSGTGGSNSLSASGTPESHGDSNSTQSSKRGWESHNSR